MAQNKQVGPLEIPLNPELFLFVGEVVLLLFHGRNDVPCEFM
jgi:hypothetical protein